MHAAVSSSTLLCAAAPEDLLPYSIYGSPFLVLVRSARERYLESKLFCSAIRRLLLLGLRVNGGDNFVFKQLVT